MTRSIPKPLRAVVGVLSLILVGAIEGQAPPGASNPWTGKQAPPSQNFLTGAAAQRYKANPFTGAVGTPAVNPLTGRPVAPPSINNPWIAAETRDGKKGRARLF